MLPPVLLKTEVLICSGSFAYCSEIKGLLSFLKVEYLPVDWCLFVDSSSTSLKAALMSSEAKYPTFPIAYATIKETRSSIEEVIKLINYDEHEWPVYVT